MALPIAQQKTRTSNRGEILYGILSGLVPLLFLGGLTVVSIILTALVRQSFSAEGFFVWQHDALIALLTCLLLTVLIYVTSLVIVLRQVTMWQRDGLAARCTATLWTLIGTACIVLLPIVLAVVLPQHPTS